MKVMQILPAMDIGGVERGVVDLTRFYKDKDKDVDNIVVSKGGRLVQQLEESGVTHYKLSVHKKSPLSLFLIPKLRKIIKVENIDIVHARSRVPAWIGFFATRGTRANFITTAHGVYKNRFFSEVMAWGKYIICPSRVVARHMKNNFGVPEEKIILVERWVDLDKFQFKDYHTKVQNNVIVSVGRISPTKGYEYLIKGFKKLVRFNPYLKLKIIGSADASKKKYLEYLKSLVTRFSLNYNVEFLGFRGDVEKIIADARMLIAPSVIEESFGRVVIEAFACGTPVIATNIGGFKEIIDNGVNGILVEPANSEQISEAILKILEDPTYAQKLTIKAREKVVQSYAMQRCLQLTGEVYHKTSNTVKILVIKISSLGDLILSFPALSELRQQFPHAEISLLTLKKYNSLVYDCPYIDEVIALDDRYKRIKNILNIAKGIRRKSFDYIIDLQNSRCSHLISFLSFPRCSFGYSLRWGFLLSKRVKYSSKLSPLKSQEQILQLLGVRFKEKKLIFWKKESSPTINLPHVKLIGINVSASLKWQSKNWPVHQIHKLIELINKNFPKAKVVLFGDKDSINRAGEIMKGFGTAVVNACGRTSLKDLPQLLKRLNVFITPDTSTLHLASALDVPTIAIFGPTDPQRHVVKSDNLYIFYKQLDCSFCYKPQCNLAEDSLCLEKVSAQIIFTKIKEILDR